MHTRKIKKVHYDRLKRFRSLCFKSIKTLVRKKQMYNIRLVCAICLFSSLSLLYRVRRSGMAEMYDLLFLAGNGTITVIIIRDSRLPIAIFKSEFNQSRKNYVK